MSAATRARDRRTNRAAHRACGNQNTPPAPSTCRATGDLKPGIPWRQGHSRSDARKIQAAHPSGSTSRRSAISRKPPTPQLRKQALRAKFLRRKNTPGRGGTRRSQSMSDHPSAISTNKTTFTQTEGVLNAGLAAPCANTLSRSPPTKPIELKDLNTGALT